MDVPKTREFRAMLVKISDNINPEDLNKLKSMCKDIIGQRNLSKLDQPIMLFEALEQQRKLTPNDVSFLTYLLEKGCLKNGPILMSSHLTPYKTKWLSSKDTLADMQKLANYLADNLGKEYRRVLRLTGLPDQRIDQLQDDYPRNSREVMYRGFCECFREPISASLEDVLKALEDARCKSLAEQIKKMFS